MTLVSGLQTFCEECLRPGGGLTQRGGECAVLGAVEDIFHSSAILGALGQCLSRSTVDEGSGSFCVGFWRVGVRRGCGEALEVGIPVGCPGLRLSGRRLLLDVSCFLYQLTPAPAL